MVQAADSQESLERAVIHRVHSRTGQTISHRHDRVQHTTKVIKINGVNTRLHMCMNSQHKIVQCDHIHIGFTYDRNLVNSIMQHLPRFIHKHAFVYKMYTTLKLYYLHQQELLQQVLALLNEHMHSHDLERTMKNYLKIMHGKNFGWVDGIETLLKKNMVFALKTPWIVKHIHHHKMIYKMHSMIRHAAIKNHKMIHKMYHVMKSHGFTKASAHLHSMKINHKAFLK